MTEPPCLGIDPLWTLPSSHPFHSAGVQHDAAYEVLKPGESTRIIDAEFFWRCWQIAKDRHSTTLKAEAVLFYALCRAWGTYRFYVPYKPKE